MYPKSFVPGWLTFRGLAGIFTNRKYDALLKDLQEKNTALQNEVHELHKQIVPAVGRLAAELSHLAVELSQLHGRVVPQLNSMDAEVRELRDQLTLQSVELRNGAERFECLMREQSSLHDVVIEQCVPKLGYLNRQMHALKGNLYHADWAKALDGLNGQFSKHLIFRHLIEVFSFEVFVETGTFLGSTALFFASTGKPVYTVEVDPTFHNKAQAVLRNEPQVRLTLGDSREFLEQLTTLTIPRESLTFFYLDAHWGDHLPLLEELNTIAVQHPRAVVMVDDFKVADDSGYGYDSYPNGQAITLALVDSEIQKHGWQVFFPAMPSFQDHMTTDVLLPRGTAVLACDPEIIAALERVRSLRHWQL